ncbi:MAG: hypothetical protein ACLFUH_07620 [Bacteroidales bacterium]
MEDIVQNLKALIAQEKEYGRDLNEASWGTHYGILITAKDAQRIVDFIERGNQSEAKGDKPSAPHACPVCGGNGLVLPGFYSQNPGDWMSVTNAHEKCRSCNGTGVLWG